MTKSKLETTSLGSAGREFIAEARKAIPVVLKGLTPGIGQRYIWKSTEKETKAMRMIYMLTATFFQAPIYAPLVYHFLKN